MDMDACHILLGRPWEFDLNAIHKGRDNIYTFTFNCIKMMIVPLEEHVPSTTKPTTTTKNNLIILAHRVFEEEIKGNLVIYEVIAIGEIQGGINNNIHDKLFPLMREF